MRWPSRRASSAPAERRNLFTRTGRTYRVWKSTTLANDWQPVGPPVPGDDTLKIYTDAISSGHAFFRVSVEIP